MEESFFNQHAQDQPRHERRKIPALTGIRGIAACWVVLLHYVYVHADAPQTNGLIGIPVISRGYLGVDLFFILSGFVLHLTHSKKLKYFNLEELRNFAISRFFRVYPLHWAVLAVFAVVYLATRGNWLAEGQGPYNVRTFFLAAGLVQSWAMLPRVWNEPTWSLSNELLAYLAFPLLMVGVWRVRIWWQALVLALCAVALLGAICVTSHEPGLDHLQRIGIARCLLEFPAGMLISRMLQLQTFSGKLASRCFWGGVALLAGTMVSVRLDILALPAFSALIVASAVGSLATDRAFGSRAVLWLGEISYSIYLTHFLLLEVADRVAEIYFPGAASARMGLMTVAALAILPVSYCTWRYIEMPGQAYGRKLSRSPKATAAAPDIADFANASMTRDVPLR